MKNVGFVLAVLAVALVLSGCVTPASGGVNIENHGRFGEQVRTPAKDFESRGLVFTESRFEIVSGRGTLNGETFTYQALLREAQRLGADAIINVTIDKRMENITQGATTTRREVWFGSALAIRYTDTITATGTTVTNNGTATTTQNTSEAFMNDGRSVTQGGGASVGEEQSGGRSGGLLGGLFGR